MSKIIPKLNLNKTPQLVENNSLIYAKNIRLLNDGTLAGDTMCVTNRIYKNYVGQIVGLNDEYYLFTTTDIYVINEILSTVSKLNCKWTYHGANSTEGHYIGWDYQLDQYNADGVMVASERIRINLANEDCYSVIKPYYVSNMTTSAVTEANVYTDEKIEVVEEKINLILEGTAIVEFD